VSNTPQWREPTEEEEQSAPRVNGFSFWEAFSLALSAVEPVGTGADPGPMADYVASDLPLTSNDRQLLAALFRMLPTSLPRGDRGKGKRNRAGSETEYQLARRVMDKQKAWCEQNPTRTGVPRQHVPVAVTTQMIKDISGNSPRVVDTVLRLLKNKSRL